MIRIDRLCIWVLITGLIFLVPSFAYIKFIDELCAASLAAIAVFDCLVNQNWRKYKSLFVIMAIMTFYAAYSLTLNNNTLPYIMMDWVIEIKPFIPFAVFLAVAPQLTPTDKRLIKTICTINGLIICVIFFGGYTLIQAVVFHISYTGIVLFISSIFILYCSIEKDGSIKRNDLLLAVFFLIYGLAGTRSKYYGIFILSLFFLFYYRPKMLHGLSWKTFAILICICLLVVLAVWKKFSYYFLTGGGEKFDPTVAASFARPVLYATGGLIFMDYFPLGSGLASFASYPSDVSYSNIYFEYGINNVDGLSPQTGYYICDAYFPSLAQFGVIGVGLFIYFWTYAYSYLRFLIRNNGEKYRYAIAIGILIICFILIECTSANTFTQSAGMVFMILLGIICGKARLEKHELKETTATDITNNDYQPALRIK